MELVDTDVLIDVQRGHPPALNWFESLTALPAISGFVAMELIQDARNSREVAEAKKLTAPFQFVWPTEVDCERAMFDFTAYHLSHNLGLIDALIAASALGRNATLLTFNEKHYRVVPGLVIRKPYNR